MAALPTAVACADGAIAPVAVIPIGGVSASRFSLLRSIAPRPKKHWRAFRRRPVKRVGQREWRRRIGLGGHRPAGITGGCSANPPQKAVTRAAAGSTNAV
jgi:hypothetical protein